MKLSLVFAWVLLIAAAPPVAPSRLSPAGFRDRLAGIVAKETGNQTIAIDDRSFKAKRADGTELTILIDNAYNQYLGNPDQADAIIARYVRIVLVDDNVQANVEDVVVIVRPNDYLSASLPTGSSTADFPQPRRVAGDLSFFLAIDSPETIRLVSLVDLAKWKIDEASAWQRGVENLKSHVGPLAISRLGSKDGAIGLTADSGLAPSLLADPAFCGEAAPDALDGQTVLVYSREMFLFAKPSDVNMTKLFWKTAKEEIAAGRSMSDTPLSCRGGRWQAATAP